MHKYIKLTPNFHIFLNPAKRFKTDLNLTFSSGGAFFEKSNQKGLTHLLEHSIIKQTKKINKKELNQLLFEKDIYRNASTSVLTQDISMSAHKDYAEQMLDLILNFAFDPNISDEILEQEKQIVLREIAQRKGDPMYKLWRLVTENIYKEGSKDLCEVTGDEDIVANATIKDLKDIHKRVLSESHFLLSVVGGNVNEDQIIKKAEKFAKELPFEKTHPIDQNAENFIQDFKYKPIVSELAHDHCVLTLSIPCRINYGNRSIRDIISEILFYYPEGIFYKILREELGLIYSVDYYYDESLQLLRIRLVGELNNVNRLIEESIKILAEPAKYINPKKVNIIKNLYIKRQQIASDNPYTSVDFLMGTLLTYGIEQNYEEYLDEIKQLSFEEIINYGFDIKAGIKDAFIVAVSKNKEIEKLNFEKFLNV